LAVRRPAVGVERRIAILLHRAPALETVVEQDLPHGGEIDVALAEIAEDALSAGIIETGAVGDRRRLSQPGRCP
jgi:lipid-binding SYLF domain-containing protein